MTLKLTMLKLCQKSLLFFTCLAVIYSFPLISDAAPAAELATNQNTDIASSSNQLRTAVQQAVNSSIQDLGVDTTLDTNTSCRLVNDIVTKLLAAGVKTTPRCKPRTLEQLKQLFMDSILNRPGFSSHDNNNCLGLEKLSGFEEDIYYVTTSSSCPQTRIHIDPVCYGSGNQSQTECSMDTELQPISDDLDELENYFPRFKLQIMCRGCSISDSDCLREHNNCYVNEKRSPRFFPLKRDTTDECDSNGYEKWILDRTRPTTATVACSCSRRS